MEAAQILLRLAASASPLIDWGKTVNLEGVQAKAASPQLPQKSSRIPGGPAPQNSIDPLAAAASTASTRALDDTVDRDLREEMIILTKKEDHAATSEKVSRKRPATAADIFTTPKRRTSRGCKSPS